MKKIHPFTKVAGLKSDKQFYERYKSPEDFFVEFPEARNGMKVPKAIDSISIPGSSAFGFQGGIPDDVQKGFNNMRSDSNLAGDPIAQQQMKPNMGLPPVSPNMASPFKPVAPIQSNPKFQVKFNKKLNPKGGVNTNDVFAGSLQGVNALLPYQQPINQNQPLYNNAVQSNPYGTNSGATFAKGGMLQGSNLKVEKNQFKYISPDTIKLGGNYHSEQRPDGSTGTDISYNGIPVEAEKNETLHLDDQGNLIVGGNMKIPGTNTKYKKGFEKVAKFEEQNEKIKDKAAFLLNNYSPDYKWSASTNNTGVVLADAYEQKKAATSDLKQELTDMQNLQLDYVSSGMKPKEAQKAASGKKLKGAINYFPDPEYPEVMPDDTINGNLPEFSFSAKRQPIRVNDNIDKLPTNSSYLMDDGKLNQLPIYSNRQITINQPNSQNIEEVGLPDIMGPESGIYNNNNITTPIKGMRNRFNPLNYLAEASTIFDRPEPVPSTQVRAITEPEYNISYQGKKNAIISAYKPAISAVSNNPAQQAAIAGQMAEQLANVDSEEIMYNQQNNGGIRARNLQEFRNVRDTNTRLGEDQQNKRMQAKSITQDNRFRAIQSISDKEAKRKYLNNQLGLEEDLVGWRYNNKNTEQQWQMLHPDEPFPGLRVAAVILDDEDKKTKKKTTVDNKGKRTDSSETTTSGTSYLGGMIAERKPMTTKKRLKYA